RCLLAPLFVTALWSATLGPAKGTLVIVGGGEVGPEILSRFIDLAGGKDAPVVYIPTAAEGEPSMDASATILARAGMTHITMLHTRDRSIADTEEFAKPIAAARGVWFEGGRQWRLADSYLHTRTEKELFRLLERGGVIGGTSAGATIQGSYMVRGAVEGNTVMMAPGHEVALGFLRNTAIDQHLLVRHREKDLLQVIEKHPELLGIGLDESTAIIVHGDQFEVVGKSKVAIYDARYKPAAGGERYYFLSSGDRFDLKRRKAMAHSAGAVN
ncbi:MAG TPA: cyanophycinase, partial [Bryobacteraceae bacterium]